MEKIIFRNEDSGNPLQLPVVFAGVLILQLLVLFPVNSSAAAEEAAGEDVAVTLKGRREEIKTWAPSCPEGEFYGQYTEAIGQCAQGDIVLFSGLGCLAATLAGDSATSEARCRDVARSQGPEGRWWRGATRVGKEGPNSFSRDMARGVFAYLAARGVISPLERHHEEARQAARRWWQWISIRRTLCPATPQNPNCEISLGIRSLMFHVFSSMKLRETDPGLFTPEDWDWIRRASHYPYHFLPLGAAWPSGGPGLHLKAASILILRSVSPVMRREGREFLLGSAESLVRHDPQNPLFHYLAEGATPEVVRRVLDRCPQRRPSPEKKHRDFQWQRASEDRVFDQSDGHDCVFMINLLLAEKGSSH